MTSWSSLFKNVAFGRFRTWALNNDSIEKRIFYHAGYGLFFQFYFQNIMERFLSRACLQNIMNVPDMIPAFHMEIFPSARKITAH